MNEQIKQLILKYLNRVEIKGIQEFSEMSIILVELSKEIEQEVQ